MDYRALPQVVYSQPEIAQVGLSSREAERKDIEVTISDQPVSFISQGAGAFFE